MSEVDYHVLALLPSSLPWSLSDAVEKMRSAGYVARTQTERTGDGLRVELDDGWGIIAWIEDDEEAAEFTTGLSADRLPHRITAEQIASCPRYLSIWSDDDSDFMNSVQFEEIVESIRHLFGAFIYDNRLGEWRT
jgi:hypothetical protein